MGTALFRGLPSTGGVQDVRARQVLDGIIENLRRSDLQLTTDGKVFAGASNPYNAQPLQTYTISGGGLPAAPAGDGDDAFTVKVFDADTAQYLGSKLVNFPGITGIAVLNWNMNVPAQARVKGLLAGDGVTITDLGADIQISAEALDCKVAVDSADPLVETPGLLVDKLVNLGTADFDLLGSPVGHKLAVCGLNEGEGMVLERTVDGDIEVASLGMVRVVEADEAAGYLGAKFEAYVQGLGAAGAAANCHAVVWDGSAGAVKKLQLGGAAVLEAGTVAGTLAWGNHTHGNLLGTPTADESIMFWDTAQEGWIMVNLTWALEHVLAGLLPLTADASTKFLVLTPTGALRYSVAQVCP